MKLYGLYLAEAAEADEEQGASGIGKILAAAFKGIAKALLFLTAVIVHGLLGKAVIAGKVSAKDALKASRLNRQRKFQELLKKQGRDATSDESNLEEEAENLEAQFYSIISKIKAKGDVNLDNEANLLVARFVDDDSDEGSGSFNDLADDENGVQAWQAKALFIKKMIVEAKKLLGSEEPDEEETPTAPPPPPPGAVTPDDLDADVVRPPIDIADINID